MVTIASTERTIAETLTTDDAPFILALTQTEGWIRYIGDNAFTSIEEVENYITDGFLKTYLVHGFGYYLLRAVDGTPIGIAGFLKKNYLQNPDFGFAFMPDYHGRGYATEACRAVLKYGIETFGFERLDAVTLPSNKPSIALLENLGFTEQGVTSVPPKAGDARKAEPVRLYRWFK